MDPHCRLSFRVVSDEENEQVISLKTNRIMRSTPLDTDSQEYKNYLLNTHFYRENDEYYTCTGHVVNPSWKARTLYEVHRLSCQALWEKRDSLGRILPEDILPDPDQMPEYPLPLFRHHAIVQDTDYNRQGLSGAVDREGFYLPYGLSYAQLMKIHRSSVREWLNSE